MSNRSMNARRIIRLPNDTRRRYVVAQGHIETWGPYDIAGIGSRRVRVYIPRGEAERSVVVLFDGQNIFGNRGSTAGGWHAHRAADRVATKRRPAPIVVGIDHGRRDRIHELSPFTAHRSHGRLDALVAFVRERLTQDVRTRFSIPLTPARWVVGGSSMGGLAGLYTHFAVPETFGGALCMSPSFWFAERSIFAWIAAQRRPVTSRIYMDGGVREDDGALLPVMSSMAELLRSCGYGEKELRIRSDSRGTHSEASWRRRLPGALRFLLC